MDAYIYATSEKQVELGIDNAQLTQFNAYKTQLNNDIALYTDPARRTHAITQQIQADFKEINAWILHLRTTIKISKKATLTEQDYAFLFIHQDKPRTSHTTPTPTPTLKLEHIEHLIARITAHHAASHDQGTRPSLSDRIDIIDWQWVINNIREPIDTLIYSNHKTTKTATLNSPSTPTKQDNSATSSLAMALPMAKSALSAPASPSPLPNYYKMRDKFPIYWDFFNLIPRK